MSGYGNKNNPWDNRGGGGGGGYNNYNQQQQVMGLPKLMLGHHWLLIIVSLQPGFSME